MHLWQILSYTKTLKNSTKSSPSCPKACLQQWVPFHFFFGTAISQIYIRSPYARSEGKGFCWKFSGDFASSFRVLQKVGKSTPTTNINAENIQTFFATPLGWSSLLFPQGNSQSCYWVHFEKKIIFWSRIYLSKFTSDFSNKALASQNTKDNKEVI